MSEVPSNLIPTRITQLPLAPVASADSTMMIVYQGRNYQIRVGDLLSVSGVPTTTQVIAGTALTGGGPLTGNVTLSVAPKAIGVGQLADSGVSSGTYGSATNIPVLSIDSMGRVTSASTVALSVSGFVPVGRQVAAGDGLTGGGGLGGDIAFSANYSAQPPLPGFQTGSPGTWVGLSRGDHRHPAVDLAADDQVDNILKLNNGGTGRSMVMNPGAIIWSGSEGLYAGPPGAAGQVLVSGGAAAPTWGSVLVSSDQPANVVYAGPETGADAPAGFRRLVNADIPAVFTGKTISGSDNTLSNIGNTSLTNSSLTINGQTVSLGGTATITSTNAHQLLFATGFSSSPLDSQTVPPYDGSAEITVHIDPSVVTVSGAQTLIGKVINAHDNPISNIENDSLVHSSVTINGQSVSLGGSITIASPTPSTLTLGTGLSGGSYNGSTAVTAAIDSNVVATLTDAQTLANKTISGTNNTLSNIGNSSLTNSSITINGQSVSLGGSTTISAPASSTLTLGFGLNGGSYNGSAAAIASVDTSVVATVGSNQTLTGKTIAGNQNTLSNIANSSLTNSSVTINGQTVSLGGSITIGTSGSSSPLTLGTGLTGGSYNGSAAVTTAIADTGVTAGSYGATNQALTATVNAQGQLTSLAAANISISANQITSGALSVVQGGTNTGTYAVGDMLYASATSTLATLQIGPNGSMITSNGTRPVYIARSLLTVGKATNIDGGAAGGLPFQSGTGATIFLPLGSPGKVLIAGPLGPTWGDVGSGTF